METHYIQAMLYLRIKFVSVISIINDDILLDDLPNGPLNIYRERATFNWKRMRLYTLGYDALEFQHRVWSAMEKDAVFSKSYGYETIEETRANTFRRLKR
ncbi:ACOX3 [Bugula neritina]|uniref:ACOX3 n=1 Tax=Bugula neritina TaxID=10212 RepID=A0A7J7JAV3_BUGNE|nr:ACOX3 [Bugula neritina]